MADQYLSSAVDPSVMGCLCCRPLLQVTTQGAGELVLVVSCEADLGTAAQLRDQLIAALSSAPPAVVVDLSGLSFCDLSGLDALYEAVRVADDKGVVMTFRGASRQLSWLLRTFPPPVLAEAFAGSSAEFSMAGVVAQGTS